MVSTASVGSLGGDGHTFAQDRDAVEAITHALGDDGRTLIFTSGSAVFGVFAGGAATDTIYDEDAAVPLSQEVFAPTAAGLHPMLAAGLGTAMSAAGPNRAGGNCGPRRARRRCATRTGLRPRRQL